MPETYRLYGLEYCHNGSRWSIDILATSEEDALERARQIYYAKCLGAVEMTIPAAVPGAGWFTRFYCWLREVIHA